MRSAAPRARAARAGARRRRARLAGATRWARSWARSRTAQQRQLEVGMASATDPKLMMLDEPASGLSRGERERLTELLLSLPADVTLILIEHDMDIALRVAAVRDDDARRPEGRRGHARRDPRQPDGARHLPREPVHAMSDAPAPRARGRARVLRLAPTSSRASRSRWAHEAIAVIGRNGMGKSTLCNTIMGLCRETRGSIKRRRQGAARHGCPTSSPPRASATSRRAAGCSRRSRSTSTCA